MDTNRLRICRKCVMPHYENCPECFGFGLRPGREVAWVPVTVKDACLDIDLEEIADCPTCKSTFLGIPFTAR